MGHMKTKDTNNEVQKIYTQQGSKIHYSDLHVHCDTAEVIWRYTFINKAFP
jgi:predicted glycoside hydrolase/deacetylase ChbG (UPF0249 family)